jgi:hypothetical protein
MQRQRTYYLAILKCDLDEVIVGLAFRVALAEYFSV